MAAASPPPTTPLHHRSNKPHLPSATPPPTSSNHANGPHSGTTASLQPCSHRQCALRNEDLDQLLQPGPVSIETIPQVNLQLSPHRSAILPQASATHSPYAKDVGSSEFPTNESTFSIHQECRISTPASVAEHERSSFSPLVCASIRSEACQVHEPISAAANMKVYDRSCRTEGHDHATMSCPPLGRLQKVAHRFPQKRGIYPNRDVKRLYDMPLDKDEKARQGAFIKDSRGRRRRRSLPVNSAKTVLPEDFILAQKSHFATVDAFELEEEEAGSEEE